MTATEAPSAQSAPDVEGPVPACRKRRCRALLLAVLLVLGALFTYSLAVQFNDGADLSLWLLFYALHALVALVGAVLLSPCCGAKNSRWPEALKAAAVVMGVWSVIMIILSGINLAKTEAGGDESGGDNDRATEREEKAYELAGSVLGLVSSTYVACLVKASINMHRLADVDCPVEAEESRRGELASTQDSDQFRPEVA